MLAMCLVAQSLVGNLTASAGWGTDGYSALFRVPIDGVEVRAVFGRYGVGFSGLGGSPSLVAVDLLTGGVRTIATADSVGLDVRSARFAEVDGRLVVYDGRLVLVYDGSLSWVGRLAADNLVAATALPSGTIVGWGADYVMAARPPHYVGVALYDVWEPLVRFLLAGGLDPGRLLYDTMWKDVRAELDALRKKLYEAATSLGGAVVWCNETVYYDVLAPTVREMRERLRVSVSSAMVLPSGEALATLNAVIPVTLRVVGEVVYPVGNGTTSEVLEFSTTYTPSVGMLVSVSGADGSLGLLEVYDEVEAGAIGPSLAYVYRPLSAHRLKQRVLKVVTESGEVYETPIYFSGKVSEVRTAGEATIVLLDSGVALVFRGTSLLWSFRASRIADTGVTASGRLYVAYTNVLGAYELGYVDLYSGRAGKLDADLEHEIAGAFVSEDERLLVAVGVTAERSEIVVYCLRGFKATLRVTLVDQLGRTVSPIVWGEAVVTSGELRVSLPLRENPFIVSVPAPSTVDIVAAVPYGVARDSIRVVAPTDRSYDVIVRVTPSPGFAGAGAAAPYTSPFYLDHALVRDTEILKYVLPGARLLDAHGSYVVLVRGRPPSEPSTVSLYRLGGEEMWSKTIYGFVDGVRLLYPYVAVKGISALHVLDVATGATRGSVSMTVDGFDLDLETDYASAWNSRTVAVLDIRRGEAVYLDMSKYGEVLQAPVVGGSVFAYVRRGETIDVYVINPVKGTISEVLPLGARAVTGFATDGYFKAVSYVVGDERYTSVLSTQNGVVVIPGAGPALAVRSVGRVASLPLWTSLYGNSFALVLATTAEEHSVFAVGMNYQRILSLEAADPRGIVLTASFVATRVIPVNATPAIVLRDLGGTPRLTIVTSIAPAVLTATEQLVAYSNGNSTFVIPNPRIMGRYTLSLSVRDAETSAPLDASVAIAEYRTVVDAKGGQFRTYLSLPGRLRITVSAPYYHDETVEVELSDERPVASVTVMLKPKLFTLTVRLVTYEGEVVREGRLTVQRKDPPLTVTVDVSQTNRVERLRVGNYTVVFTSEVFTSAGADVRVDADTTITLVVNRTAVRTLFRVRDETGRPVPGARVSVQAERVGTVELTTNAQGETPTVTLPYGTTFNYTVYARGYTSKRESRAADLTVEGKPIVVTISRFRGVATIMLRDEEGKPVSASVAIKDASGADVIPVTVVSDVYTVDLELGVYTVVGITPDGRTASSNFAVTEEMPNPVVSLVFPVPPRPIHVVYFPLILVIVVATTVAVAVYRRFFGRRKPKVVA